LKILLTGKTGQLGYELDRQQMDLTDLDQIRDVMRTVQPQLIINPAAYTAVDLAESNPDVAMRINAEAPAVMADEAKKLGAAMIHYSTDYVFDGDKPGSYSETDTPNPQSVYGRSKLAGEQAVKAAGIPHLIFRTSWIYGLRGKNFLLTVQRLAQQREELRIVADQFGAPTWSRTLAEVTAHALARLQSGISHADLNHAAWEKHAGLYHVSAQGETSWHGFTQAIIAHATTLKKPQVTAITTLDYPLPAKRPANSVLSSERFMQTFCSLPNWDDALKLCLD